MNFSAIATAITFLNPIILLAGLIYGLCKFKSLNSTHKSITVYLGIMLAFDVASRILWVLLGNNLILLLIYSLVELLLFIYFYYRFLLKARHRAIKFLGIAAVLYIFWELIIYSDNAKQFQSYAKVVDNFVVITLALAFFQEKMREFKEHKWDNFNLNIAIILYFALNLIFFVPINFLINEASDLKFYFWLANLLITLIFYSYLTNLIWQNARFPKKIKP